MSATDGSDLRDVVLGDAAWGWRPDDPRGRPPRAESHLVRRIGRPHRGGNGADADRSRELPHPRQHRLVRHRVPALEPGSNDLVIAVSEDFGGWGIPALSDDLDGPSLG